MKITGVETFLCRAGWRDWAFLKIETNEGIVGYADCTDSHGSLPGVLAAIDGIRHLLVGRDPRAIERVLVDICRITRQSAKGVVKKALAAVENALLDIKARALGIPVYELLGGPVRDKVQLYWSHCGSTRIRSLQYLDGVSPVESLSDISALGQEAVEKGFSGIKTNPIIFEGDNKPYVLMQGFKGPGDSIDRKLTNATLRQIETLVGTFREAIGPDTNLILDTNMHFRSDGNLRLASALGPYNLTWMEVDSEHPDTLKHLRDKAPMPIGSCEKYQGMDEYMPFFQSLAMDVAIIDVRWNGILQSKKIADIAQIFEINVAPHNHGSPLATLITAHFCYVVTNLLFMEYDVDDVPWRNETISVLPEIKDGHLYLPDGPGWGAELNEELIRAHVP